jgi:hypothetical protein
VVPIDGGIGEGKRTTYDTDYLQYVVRLLFHSALYSAAMTASPKALVPALPPTSPVRVLASA